MHKSQIYFANVEMYYCMLLKKLNYSTHIKSSKSVDIGTCLALWDDFEKIVESNNELHMYVSQNLQTDSIWLVSWLVVV